MKIENVEIEWQEISKAVLQGSILGLLIFNICMHDLFYFVKRGNSFKYADDNSVSVNSKELNIALLTGTCVIDLWLFLGFAVASE